MLTGFPPYPFYSIFAGMQFHLALQPPSLDRKISLKEKLLLMGTCFAENIGSKLSELKFDVLENPNGILYNPISICKAIDGYLEQKEYTADDLFLHNGLWTNWDHHGRFAHPDQEKCLQLIQLSQQEAILKVKSLDWLIITSGTAYVYELKKTGQVVGNCHKVPAREFDKKLIEVGDITGAFENMLLKLFKINPEIKVIFTVSPVRYTRDGIVQNNLSKSILLQASHHLVEKFQNAYYFPAYELVIDDLRDYRFFKGDLVHPNEQAITYVWEKFESACIDAESLKILEKVKEILRAKSHRPLHPDSSEHRAFKKKYLETTKRLALTYPWLNLKEEENFFSK